MSRRNFRLTLTALASALIVLVIGFATQPSGAAIGALPFLQPVNTPDPNPTPDPVDPGDDGGTTNINRAPAQSVGYESLGSVSILTAAPTTAYNGPGGDVIILGDEGLILPRDADGNGFDTYVITGVATVDDELWLALFIGSDDPVWIPASAAAQIVLRLEEDTTPSTRFGLGR